LSLISIEILCQNKNRNLINLVVKMINFKRHLFIQIIIDSIGRNNRQAKRRKNELVYWAEFIFIKPTSPHNFKVKAFS